MKKVKFFEDNDLGIEAATEWVRGNQNALLDRFAPLVRAQSLVLDFSAVQRIDAAGLAALVSLYRSARERGHNFAITNPANHVAQILAVVGLDRILLAGSRGPIPAFEPGLAQTAAA